MSAAAQKMAASDEEQADPLIRKPRPEDGAAIWELVAACPPLDQNSMYCNLLQVSDFSDTSMLAERDGEIIAWVSGYRPPREPDVLFVWQVAVSEAARGEGMGKRLIRAILAQNAPRGVKRLKTTITPDNAASWGLFRSLARDLVAPMRDAPHFTRDVHFAGHHDTEQMVEIGPFEPPTN